MHWEWGTPRPCETIGKTTMSSWLPYRSTLRSLAQQFPFLRTRCSFPIGLGRSGHRPRPAGYRAVGPGLVALAVVGPTNSLPGGCWSALPAGAAVDRGSSMSIFGHQRICHVCISRKSLVGLPCQPGRSNTSAASQLLSCNGLPPAKSFPTEPVGQPPSSTLHRSTTVLQKCATNAATMCST